ncbi:hypothetical protein SEA_DRAKE55_35 [Mycobacterium phage Drake55]|nr:hypothetical protein SEA_DRAKE55_35 [Mycobacterium phage Drake55]
MAKPPLPPLPDKIVKLIDYYEEVSASDDEEDDDDDALCLADMLVTALRDAGFPNLHPHPD